jgi:hypothetical protein
MAAIFLRCPVACITKPCYLGDRTLARCLTYMEAPAFVGGALLAAPESIVSGNERRAE